MKSRFIDVLNEKEDNYILPFFWQHGEDEKTLREYMDKIYNSNIREVCIESRPHPDFCGDKWWEDMDVIMDEARKKNMKVWVLDDSHFPSGYANGAVESASKELCHQYIFYRKLSVCGPMPSCEIRVPDYMRPQPPLPFLPKSEPPKRVFNDDKGFAIVACKLGKSGEIEETIRLDIPANDDSLYWDVPIGFWEIYLIYLTRDGHGRNDYINFLDENSCRLAIDAVYVPHYNKYKKDFGNTFAGFFSDEPPIGNTSGYTIGDVIGKEDMELPWSDRMLSLMNEKYGSEKWIKNLPMLWHAGTADVQAQIRMLYMDCVTQLVSDCYSVQIGKWCHDHGVEYIGHIMEHCDVDNNLGASVGHYFRGLKGMDMAGIDNIGGQINPGAQHVKRRGQPLSQNDENAMYYTMARLATSYAAIDPKKKGRSLCENFGAHGWNCGVKKMKYLSDHFLARGINHYVPHAFSPAPFPDPDCPPHFYAHGNNAEYNAFGHLMQYVNRVCHLISNGKSKTRVALLYHVESSWGGDYVSNSFVAEKLVNNQIEFHIIPSDVFKYRDYYDAELVDGNLRINDNVYDILLISKCDYITDDVIRFINEASKREFPIWFIDKIPRNCIKSDLSLSAYVQIHTLDNLIQDLNEELDIRSVMESINDGSEQAEDLIVYNYHNLTEDMLIIFNENAFHNYEGNVNISRWIGDTVDLYDYVIYDPWSGTCKSANIGNGRIHVSIDCFELIILVGIKKGIINDHIGPQLASVDDKNDSYDVKVVDISKCEVWALETQADADFVKISGITEFINMGKILPDFSGIFRYKFTIENVMGKRTVLSVPYMGDSYAIWVNNQFVDYYVDSYKDIDVTPFILEGNNTFRIEVYTTPERQVYALGADVYCMNMPAPVAPIGIVGKLSFKVYY